MVGNSPTYFFRVLGSDTNETDKEHRFNEKKQPYQLMKFQQPLNRKVEKLKEICVIRIPAESTFQKIWSTVEMSRKET